MLLAMAIFGTIGLVRRCIPYGSGTIAFVRGIIGTLFLFVIKLIRHEKFDASALKKNLPLLCLSGGMIGLDWILLFEAYNYTTISIATMCYYMAPVFIMLASTLLLHERLTKKKGICSFVAFVGMLMVSGLLESGLSDFTGVRGILLGVAAAGAYAAIVIINKFIKDVPANDRTMVQLGVSAVVIVPYVLFTEDFSSLSVTPFIILMLAVAGVINTGLAYALYFAGLEKISVQSVALMSYIDPIIAVILSVVVLKEAMTPLMVVGVVLVIGSLAMSELDLGKKKKLGT